jgi:hypothetical protein
MLKKKTEKALKALGKAVKKACTRALRKLAWTTLLTGPAGMGKSRLALHMCDWCASTGSLVSLEAAR